MPKLWHSLLSPELSPIGTHCVNLVLTDPALYWRLWLLMLGITVFALYLYVTEPSHNRNLEL